MRRISPAFALAAVVLLPSLAVANEHRIRPSEVLLSDGGDDAVQFIELIDASVEGFPNSYFLGVYDADGRSLGSVTLPDPDPLTPGRILISTAEADEVFGTNGNAELDVALPPAGQVCFEAIPAAKISCLSWGCINSQLVGTGMFPSAEAAAPPDGDSAQLQGDGTGAANFQLASPTPGEANGAGEAAPACPTDPDAGPSDIDAGTGGDADAAPDGPDGGGGSGDGGDGDDDDSGCGCRASSSQGMGTGLLALATLFAIGRRRRIRGRDTRI